jgi:[ribosomal protein S5]-alanine N-acetyltransferase
MAVTRLVSLDDAGPFAGLLIQNRDYLAPWSPMQAEAYFTEYGQREVLRRDLEAYERGGMLPLAILDRAGAVCGRINLNSIIRGAFQSASVGYWVSQSRAGHGLASAAVADAIKAGFGDLGLHRLEAGTLLHNTPSQRVLTRNGFRPFAVAEAYLSIAGKWQDHLLFQLLNPAIPLDAEGRADQGSGPARPQSLPGLALRLGESLSLVLDV